MFIALSMFRYISRSKSFSAFEHKVSKLVLKVEIYAWKGKNLDDSNNPIVYIFLEFLINSLHQHINEKTQKTVI